MLEPTDTQPIRLVKEDTAHSKADLAVVKQERQHTVGQYETTTQVRLQARMTENP